MKLHDVTCQLSHQSSLRLTMWCASKTRAAWRMMTVIRWVVRSFTGSRNHRKSNDHHLGFQDTLQSKSKLLFACFHVTFEGYQDSGSDESNRNGAIRKHALRSMRHRSPGPGPILRCFKSLCWNMESCSVPEDQLIQDTKYQILLSCKISVHFFSHVAGTLIGTISDGNCRCMSVSIFEVSSQHLVTFV